MSDRVFVDKQHYEIHQGHAFSFTDVVTLGANGNKELLFYVPSGTVPHMTFDIVSCSGEAMIKFYEGPLTYFNGSGSLSASPLTAGNTGAMTALGTCAASVFNRNRADAKSFGLGISGLTAAVGAAASGTRIFQTEMGIEVNGVAQAKTASTNSPGERHEWMLAGSQFYWLQIGSRTAGNRIAYDIEWYE